MNKKIFAILTIILVITIGISLNSVLAKNDKNSDIPEQDGIYNVPGHPELKVRVFVHKAKPGPTPTPTPTLKCGLDDPDSLFVVDSAGWKMPSDFSYKLNAGSVPASVGGLNLATIAASGFGAWNSEIPTAINFTIGTTGINRAKLDNNNIIAWGTAPGSALAETYIWYNKGTGFVTELDTIMNQKFAWTWSGGNSTCAYKNSYDAQAILTHEIGHWFGLDDHYTIDYANNTMYGYGSTGDAKADTLTTGDIDGLQIIYP